MKRILLVIGLVVIASAFGIAHWHFYGEKPEAGQIATSVVSSATNNLPVYKGQSLNFLGEAKDLASYPKNFVEAYRARLVTAIEMTSQYPKDGAYWIEIGIVKKTINNFIGARDAWEHARLLNEKNPVVYNNLGNLYALYLWDFQKAEQYYKKSIDLDPTSAQPYLVLSDFYKNFLKEKSDLADNVLLSGLQKLPNDGGLILNLALYYRSIGDKAPALKYFEQFLKLPGLTGTQQEAAKAEIAALNVGQQ